MLYQYIILRLLLLSAILSNFAFNQSIQKPYRYEVYYGVNYSNYTTTNNVGKYGQYLGINRITNIGPITIKYGVGVSSKKMLLNNKKLRSDDFDGGMTLNTSDINNDYRFFEINSILSTTIIGNKIINISPLIGIGYSINYSDQTQIVHTDVEYGNDTYQVYDYRYANAGVAPILNNSGIILQFGLAIDMKSYTTSILYTSHEQDIVRAKTYLVLNESIQSISLIVGKRF